LIFLKNHFQTTLQDEEISASDYSDFKKMIESKIIQLGKEKTEKNTEGMDDNSNIVEKALELFVSGENALFKTKKGAQALLELPLLPIGSP